MFREQAGAEYGHGICVLTAINRSRINTHSQSVFTLFTKLQLAQVELWHWFQNYISFMYFLAFVHFLSHRQTLNLNLMKRHEGGVVCSSCVYFLPIVFIIQTPSTFLQPFYPASIAHKIIMKLIVSHSEVYSVSAPPWEWLVLWWAVVCYWQERGKKHNVNWQVAPVTFARMKCITNTPFATECPIPYEYKCTTTRVALTKSPLELSRLMG